MNIETNIIMPLILSAAIVIAAISLRRWSRPGARSLAVMSVSIGIWAIAHLLQQFESQRVPGALIAALFYLGATIAASAQLGFSLAYMIRIPWKPQRLLLVLAAVPVLTQLLFWIHPTHQLLFSQADDLGGIWARVVDIYIYTAVGVSVLFNLDAFRRKLRPSSHYAWVIPAGSILPLLAQILAMSLPSFVVVDKVRLGAFTLAAVGFVYGLLSHEWMESVPLSRGLVVEKMNEGWMVLDDHQVIVDVNPTAERMVGMPREKIVGQPISSILGDFSSLGTRYDGVQELEMKRSYKTQEGGWRYLSIRISAVLDEKNAPLGHLVTWQDITDRRMAEDARQRARDEMFVLLNAISSEARESTSLEEFLTGSIYQIISAFRSQMVTFFLTDDKNEGLANKNFLLHSHFGLPPESLESMPSLSMESPLFGPALKERQALVVNNPAEEQQLPSALRSTGSSCLLAVPLATKAGDEAKVIGCMIVGRKEKIAYTPDEVVRMTTIGDHVANLIDNDRRQKLAIALSERQKMIRDLHDSVTQKLYGLVYTTEAALAGIEAGNKFEPNTVLSKIADNARQALKEMRLFLYQMNPVDLEDEGFIAKLHHRLGAVEGRADTKARFLADENITLSPDKEIALYYIAQEALNNTLKHARAKNVSVTLKQGRKNVILKIEDDGCGFDPRHVDRAGLGLANMNERVSNMNGKIKITSKPGAGTQIAVTVARDHPATTLKRRR
jgi:PAS domain S-box-containing protein